MKVVDLFAVEVMGKNSMVKITTLNNAQLEWIARHRRGEEKEAADLLLAYRSAIAIDNSLVVPDEATIEHFTRRLDDG